MGYYQGDMYRGDFFGALGKVFQIGRKIGGSVIQAVHPSNAASGVTKAIETAMTYGTKKAPAAIMAGARVVGRHPVLAAAGAATAAAGAGMALAPSHQRMAAAAGMRVGRRHRRMRATNTKALRRALRRAYAFERIAMRTIHLLHPRKKGRFGGFRRHRRKAA